MASSSIVPTFHGQPGQNVQRWIAVVDAAYREHVSKRSRQNMPNTGLRGDYEGVGFEVIPNVSCDADRMDDDKAAAIFAFGNTADVARTYIDKLDETTAYSWDLLKKKLIERFPADKGERPRPASRDLSNLASREPRTSAPDRTLPSECSIDELLQASPKHVALLCRSSPTIPGKSATIKLISHKICCKIGMEVTHSEFLNQQFAWNELDGGLLRVPKPYRFFKYRDETGLKVGHLMMEFLSGRTLACTESAHTRDTLLAIEAVQMMHRRSRLCASMTPGPPSGARAQGFPWGDEAEIKFTSLEDLKGCLRRRLLGDELQLGGLLPGLTLCHLDLAPRNVVFMEGGEVGLLDWATSAFYPVSFEIAALHHQKRQTQGDERKFFESIITCLRSESNTSEEEIRQLAIVQGRSERFAL